jgi:pimeloyl-ACP methyl ester carboxylesterase
MPAPPSTSPREDLTIDLSDGRKLAYAEWGDPTGQPVVLMHRSPGSRLFDPGPDATDEVRLITVDRPGYGGTHPVAEPSFAAVAQDLSALAEALELSEIALMGWSGGGQFALASVPALAGRLASLTLICTPAPDDAIPWYPEESRPMLPAVRADPVGTLPGVAEGFGAMMAEPDALAASDPSAADSDARSQPGVLQACAEMMREAGRQKGAGMAFDIVAGARGDRLPLDAIDIPTQLWYGARDEYITLEHGRWYAERVAGSDLEEVDGAAHLLPVVRWREILGARESA